jgi:hypothetical protein
MLIAGGCYRELCERPRWDALFGSGGRAALALAHLSKSVELHTYYPVGQLDDLSTFESAGVVVHASPSASGIAFAYFHPLSSPAIAPRRDSIVSNAPLLVDGQTVLRFGFIEGSAIVRAERAIFDPQSATIGDSFRENGSSAELLAIVLNERELSGVEATGDLDTAARRLMARERAAIVVVKRGAKGALVYQQDGQPNWVPAYESAAVFKIGSGDVFSAAFSFYWGEARLDAVAAANLASKSTATYCASRVLPLADVRDRPELRPVGSNHLGAVVIVGSANTLGARWLLEEAKSCIAQLAINAKLGRPKLRSRIFG